MRRKVLFIAWAIVLVICAGVGGFIVGIFFPSVRLLGTVLGLGFLLFLWRNAPAALKP